MSCNYNNREKVKNVQNEGLFPFLFKVEYFDVQNSNPISIFVDRDRKTLIILKNLFFRIIENIRCGVKVSLIEAGCDATRLAPLALHFVLFARRPKHHFDPEKLINSTLFAARDNNTLELISNGNSRNWFLLI